MLVILLGGGAWRVGGILHEAFSTYPIATTGAVVVFALYAVPFILLLRVIDFVEPEPGPWRATAFAWGALVATSAAISGSAALQDILAKTGSPELAARWGPALAGAGVEEVLKVLGVVAIGLLAPSRINGVVDGFVYGALVGLGFQVMENIVFALNAVALGPGGDDLGPVAVTLLLRGFLGGLWSHTLFSALAGAGVAYALVRTDRSPAARSGVASALIVAAWAFHFIWNSPLLADGFGAGPAGAVAGVLIKGIPALLVGLVLIVAAERREADYYAATLAGLADPRVCTNEEIGQLVSLRRRLASRRRARSRLGRAGARAVARLQRAQARLAVALTRTNGERARVDRGVHDRRLAARRREVLMRRHELLALSLAARGQPAPRRERLAAAAVLLAELVLVGLVAVGVGIAISALGGA
jgi:RsiW-degrading membrane proteinase PrsW (M82 family)